jgi:hypothetical protein
MVELEAWEGFEFSFNGRQYFVEGAAEGYSVSLMTFDDAD